MSFIVSLKILGLGRDGAQLAELSQRCVDPTSPNLARAQGNHDYKRNLFQISDILHWCFVAFFLL